MSSSDSGVLGVVVLARHGDRQGFYQDPLTYTASQTTITPLGNVQEFLLGETLRTMYMENNSSLLIQGINTALFDQEQVKVRADASDEGGVIFDSAVSVVQGLWPPTNLSSTTLANGTVVTAPLNGYQYVPIESVEADEDVSLEGWVSCDPFNDATAAFYNSSLFKQVASDNAAFLQSLPPFLDGRSVSLVNMWNIFDYMTVQSVHNATFANNLPDGFLERARALANFHEYGVFSSLQIDGIGNIAGRAILPSIIEGMENVANSSVPLKLYYEAISYKPFLSLFNMTGLAETYPQLAGVVNYAASTVFELRAGNTPNDPMIRFKFKNGTDDTFNTFNLFGQSGDVPLSLFKSKLQFAAINSTVDWCTVCNNNEDRGCVALATARATGAASEHHRLTPAAAGAVGAAVTIGAFVAALGILAFLGLISFGRRPKSGHGTNGSHSSTEKLDYERDRHSA
ncbi:phosphoglycerate mutase-like protein [Fomitiporia mediterranea MF3/22]|uniref:phosphoglycerate mutase-like protein n=1 Tax=Fomitiporia mediterranea (strain MF3/22) TaxID=694068 RepID=UPI000440849D|nr:phosphoglycerate mutase-like protein [Fomitiporia mediterranea MF3/22]EJD08255.1 phosphoglycerate mutase-like protein [Fomitiporia mediterranea MF3/22]